MKSLTPLAVLVILLLGACQNAELNPKRGWNSNSFIAKKVQIQKVGQSVVTVLSEQKNESVVSRYFVFQGAQIDDKILADVRVKAGDDFVFLQSNTYSVVFALKNVDLSLSDIDISSDAVIVRGYGLAKYFRSGLNFDRFVLDLKSGSETKKYGILK